MARGPALQSSLSPEAPRLQVYTLLFVHRQPVHLRVPANLKPARQRPLAARAPMIVMFDHAAAAAPEITMTKSHLTRSQLYAKSRLGAIFGAIAAFIGCNGRR